MFRVPQAPKPSPAQALRLHFSIVLYLHQTIDSEEALIESRVRLMQPKTVHTHLPRSFLFPPMTLESFSPAMPLRRSRATSVWHSAARAPSAWSTVILSNFHDNVPRAVIELW